MLLPGLLMPCGDVGCRDIACRCCCPESDVIADACYLEILQGYWDIDCYLRNVQSVLWSAEILLLLQRYCYLVNFINCRRNIIVQRYCYCRDVQRFVQTVLLQEILLITDCVTQFIVIIVLCLAREYWLIAEMLPGLYCVLQEILLLEMALLRDCWLRTVIVIVTCGNIIAEIFVTRTVTRRCWYWRCCYCGLSVCRYWYPECTVPF
jgi:hypothetical protein